VLRDSNFKPLVCPANSYTVIKLPFSINVWPLRNFTEETVNLASKNKVVIL